MSKPVPKPRRQISCPGKTEDDEPVKCVSPPQSPTKAPKAVGSAPPLVAPKKWSVRKSSEGSDSGNGTIEIVKVVAEQSVPYNYRAPPLLPKKPPKKPDDDIKEVPDASSLSDWWKKMKCESAWNSLCTDLKLRDEPERDVIKAKAEHLYKAIQLYIFLLCERVGTLREHIDDLLSISQNLNKVSRGTKIAGITGGSAAVAGGVAAAAGVILSPFTMGASLALTAVGVGVAAAGGVTGASAAIANKVNVSHDKKRIEKTFHDYADLTEDIQGCLKFINEGMEQLKKHDLSALSEAAKDSTRVRVGRVVQLATTGGGSAKAIEANSKASGLMKGFALGMDMYYTEGKDGQKLKKGLESKFGKKIGEVAEGLRTALEELVQIQDLFKKSC